MPKFSDKYVSCFNTRDETYNIQFICNHCTKKNNKITYHYIPKWNNLMRGSFYGHEGVWDPDYPNGKVNYDMHRVKEGQLTYDYYIKYGDIQDKIPYGSLTKYEIKKKLRNNPCYNTTRQYILHFTRYRVMPYTTNIYYDENGERMNYLFKLEDLYYHEEKMELLKSDIHENYMNRLKGKCAMKIMKLVC
jgi:hypothetical protein